jgi:hypothetical protein
MLKNIKRILLAAKNARRGWKEGICICGIKKIGENTDEKSCFE